MIFIPRCYVTVVPEVLPPLAYWDKVAPEQRLSIWAANAAYFKSLAVPARQEILQGIVKQCEAKKQYCFLSDAQSCLEDLGLLSIEDVTCGNPDLRTRSYRLVGFPIIPIQEFFFASQSEWAWRFFHQLGGV